MTDKIKKTLQEEPNYFLNMFIGAAIVIAILIWSGNVIDFKGLSANGAGLAKNIFVGIFTPDTSILFNFVNKEGVPYLLLETISIAFLGTLIGSILAIPLAFISSSNVVPKWFSYVGSTMIAAIRTVPAVIYGLMFIRVTGPGPFAGVLTLSVTSIGMIAKLYIEAIEELDQGIIEALDASGCNGFQKIRYGIIPQLTTNFLSTTIYRFEINLKNASVLGLVGAGGIGAPLIFAMSSHRWNEVGSILIGLIILVLLVEYFSGKIRNKLARG